MSTVIVARPAALVSPATKRWWRAAALGALVAVLAVTVVRIHTSRQQAADRRAAVAYRAAVGPILKNGGGVIVLGVQPGLADVANQRFAPEVLAHMAAGWEASLRGVRADLLRVHTPASVAGAQHLYVASLDGYIAAVRAIEQAITSTEESSRHDRLERAARLGRQADKTYNRGAAALDRDLARLGGPNGKG